jgi:hypothetical protein
VRTISVETPTHGRALIKDASPPQACWSASTERAERRGHARGLELIPGSERWTLVSARGCTVSMRAAMRKVVASWMTREDRDQAIADNLGYAIASSVPRFGRQ